METNYVAIYGISNCLALGIVEINHSEDSVTFDGLVDGQIVDTTTTQIVMKFEEESEDLAMGFMWGLNFIPFSQCIRYE